VNLYLISQGVNNEYDTYDSAVVAAESEEDATKIHPSGHDWSGVDEDYTYSSWASACDVDALLIGTTDREAGVICSSFNAG